jgi:hypothetical protein
VKAGSEYHNSPYWHVNFANKARLPDINLFKTQKLMSYAVCILAGLMGCFYFYKITSTRFLQSRIQTLQETIQNRSKANDENLRLSREFEKRVLDVEAIESFDQRSFNPIFALVAFSQVRPENLSVEIINFTRSEKRSPGSTQISEDNAIGDLNDANAANDANAYYQMSIKGDIVGTYSQALSTANKLNENLMQNDYMKNNLVSYEVKDLAQDKTNDKEFRYFILITLKGFK